MTLDYEWQAMAPKVPRGSLAEVVDALLPIHLFTAAVTKVLRDRLSIVERFIIEAALDLGEITTVDIAEVTGLQRELAGRVAARIATLGVLAPVDGAFQPVLPAAAEALEVAELREYRRVELTFLYLPRTDDLMAFEAGPGRPQPPILSQIGPAFQAPLPAALVGMHTAEFLDARIAAGTVLGQPEWLHGAEPSADRLPEVCPAYRCHGHLKGTDGRPVLRLVDAAKPDRTRSLTLPGGAPGLAARLAAQAESLAGAFAGWGDAAPVLPRRRDAEDGAGWDADLPGAAAREVMGRGLPLSRPLGLTVKDEEASVRVAIHLRPADDEARALFALDRAVATVLSTPPRELGQVDLAAMGLEPARVIDELWLRRQFFHVYELRAFDDFPYD